MATPLGSGSGFIAHYSCGEAITKGMTVMLDTATAAVPLETIDQNYFPVIKKCATVTKFLGIAQATGASGAIIPVCLLGPCMALVDSTVAVGEKVELDTTNFVLIDGATAANVVGVAHQAGPGSGNALRLVSINNIVDTNNGYGGA